MSDDNDDDYMSDKLLSKIDDARPGLLSRSQNRKYELEKKQQIKNDLNKFKNQPISIIENKNREEGLSKSIITNDSKGLNMMKKMGFKIGDSLGKQSVGGSSSKGGGGGIIEPISIKIKTDREGLGRDEVKKRKLEEIEEKNKKLFKQRLIADEFNKNIYVSNKKQLFQLKQLKKYLRKAQNICYQLDSNKNIKIPVNKWFWPVKLLKPSNVNDEDSKSKDSEKEDFKIEEEEYPCEDNDELESCISKERKIEEEEEEEEEDDDNEEVITQKLESICLYLRDVYLYCIYCGTSYNDQNDLFKNCPGPDKVDHDDE